MPKRVIRHVGYRGAILLVFGVFGLAFGLGSIGNPPRQQALDNAQVITYLSGGELWPWYVVWTFTGLVCWVGVGWTAIRWLGYALFMFVCAIFTLGYLSAQLIQAFGWIHHVERAWVSGLIFGTLSFLGYVESRRP